MIILENNYGWPYLEEKLVMTLNCQFGRCQLERKSEINLPLPPLLVLNVAQCWFAATPIFTIFEHSKAARFVSVPVLPTVAYCECKEEDMYYMYCSTKRPYIWRDKLKKQSKKLESSSVHVKVIYFELRSTTQKINVASGNEKMFCWDHLIIKSEIIKRKTKTEKKKCTVQSLFKQLVWQCESLYCSGIIN